MQAYKGGYDCILLSLSEQLSGSYNSAVLGKSYLRRRIRTRRSISLILGLPRWERHRLLTK